MRLLILRRMIATWVSLVCAAALIFTWSLPAAAADKDKDDDKPKAGAKNQNARAARKKAEEDRNKLHLGRVLRLMRLAQDLKTICNEPLFNSEKPTQSLDAFKTDYVKATKDEKDPARVALRELTKAKVDELAEAYRKFGGDGDSSHAKLRNTLCVDLGTPKKDKDRHAFVDIRVFTDPVAANAAVLADWGSVSKLIEALEQDMGVKTVRLVRANEASLNDAAKAAKVTSLSGISISSSVDGIDDTIVKPPTGSALPALDLGAAAANVVETGLAALARLIADRAKREGIGWFLETVGREMCGLDEPAGKADLSAVKSALSDPEVLKGASTNEKNSVYWVQGLIKNVEHGASNDQNPRAPVQYELRTYWFPALCALAGKRAEYMPQYGGGGKLLDGLRGALSSDIRGWPGAAAGLGLAAAFWNGLNWTDRIPSGEGVEIGLMRCRPDSAKQPDACGAVLGLRKAGAMFVGGVSSGQSATSALYALSGSMDVANRRKSPIPASRRKYNEDHLFLDGMQIAACAAAVPYIFDQYSDILPTAAGSDIAKGPVPNLDRVQKAEALIIAAFASAPACWTIFGEGVVASKCDTLGGPGRDSNNDCATRERAVDTQKPLERLTTVKQLAGRFTSGANAMEAQWGRLLQALEAYENATAGAQKGDDKSAQAKVPDLGKMMEGKTPADSLKAVQDFLAAEAQRLEHAPIVKVLQAALGVAQAGVDFAVVSLGAVEGVLDVDLYPGLNKLASEIDKLRAGVHKARSMMEAVSKDVSTLRGIASQDWGSTIAAAMASLRLHIEAACINTAGCDKIRDKLTRYTSLLVTLLSEKDPDRLAEALDAAAMPPGGFRSKIKPGTFSVTLAAMPGFFMSAEWRGGQYGVVREKWNRAYPMPALSLPFGVDIAFGGTETCGYPGLFLSILDPAAFLSFDPNNSARLPGPRITTALAPGIWGRIPLGSSPVNFVLFAVYRPGLRAWQASVNGPAADALQLGAGFSVDVTLFDLYTRRKP